MSAGESITDDCLPVQAPRPCGHVETEKRPGLARAEGEQGRGVGEPRDEVNAVATRRTAKGIIIRDIALSLNATRNLLQALM